MRGSFVGYLRRHNSQQSSASAMTAENWLNSVWRFCRARFNSHYEKSKHDCRATMKLKSRDAGRQMEQQRRLARWY